jgi:hypothetical protein
MTITLYGLVSTYDGAPSYGFEEVSLDNLPGVLIDDRTFFPNRLTPPIIVEVPEGSEVKGPPLMLHWINGDKPEQSEARIVYGYALAGIHGFRRAS